MLRLILCLVFFLGLLPVALAQGIYTDNSTKYPEIKGQQDTINTSRLKQRILHDLRGTQKPGWHNHYAITIAKMLSNFEDHGLIVEGYEEWYSVINETLEKYRLLPDQRLFHTAYIVNDPEANIIITEGGLVVVTVGLLAEIEDYNELRMLLAHELGHVHYHHTYNSYVRQRQQENLDAAATTFVAVAGGLTFGLYFGVGYGFTLSYLLYRNDAYTKLTSFLESEEVDADAYMKKLMNESEYACSARLSKWKTRT